MGQARPLKEAFPTLTVATIRAFLEICSASFWPSKSCQCALNEKVQQKEMVTYYLALQITLQNVTHASTSGGLDSRASRKMAQYERPDCCGGRLNSVEVVRRSRSRSLKLVAVQDASPFVSFHGCRRLFHGVSTRFSCPPHSCIPVLRPVLPRRSSLIVSFSVHSSSLPSAQPPSGSLLACLLLRTPSTGAFCIRTYT